MNTRMVYQVKTRTEKRTREVRGSSSTIAPSTMSSSYSTEEYKLHIAEFYEGNAIAHRAEGETERAALDKLGVALDRNYTAQIDALNLAREHHRRSHER